MPKKLHPLDPWEGLSALPPTCGDWTASERKEIGRLTVCTREFGLDLECGCTDAGDPWCVIYDLHSEVIIHIARIARRFVIAWPPAAKSARVASLRVAVDLALTSFRAKSAA
jgi:hypothetical protein